MVALTTEQIHETVEQSLVVHGAPPATAASVARAVTDSESRGNRICGLYYVESYCQQLQSGRVLGDVEPVVLRPRPGVVLVDAAYGFAQVAFDVGVDAAIEAAEECGTATFAIAHSHTATSLGYFTRRLAERGVIALGTTNSTARVAPPGGKRRTLGTNPLSFAAPGAPGKAAMVFDWSTAATALGTITMASAAGQPVEAGLAIGPDGEPTTDADVALAGSLLSAAGYKGFGLGLMVEVLSAMLTGSLASVDIPPLKAPEGEHHDIGQCYLLVDPGAFAPDFVERLDALAALVASDGSARLPGTRPATSVGIDCPDELWERISGLAVGG